MRRPHRHEARRGAGAQITPSGEASGGHLGDQVADHKADPVRVTL
jgi:hypothetical protein